MKIIALNGSSNKDGNTQFLLEKVMESAKKAGNVETKIYNAGDLVLSSRIPFCTACTSPCSGVCYKGTQLEQVLEEIKDADCLVLGSPSYFGTVSAQLKAFFDKTRRLRGEKGLYNKIGAAVTVGASKYGGQETTNRALNDIMFVHGMIIVGDGYIDDDCGHFGVSAQKPAKDDVYGIKRAEILGKRLVEVGMKL